MTTMNLIKELDEEARIGPFRALLDSIKEHNLDINDDSVVSMLSERLLELGITEARDTELSASRGLMRGAGMQPQQVDNTTGRGAIGGMHGANKKSRIGLLAKHPKQGDPVLELDPASGKLKLKGVIEEPGPKKTFIKDPKSKFGGGDTVDTVALRPYKEMGGRVAWRYQAAQ